MVSKRTIQGPQFDHVTIDFETLDTRLTAALLSVGVVFFNLHDEETHAIYSAINLESCLHLGMTVGGNTFSWWMRQPDAARNAVSIDMGSAQPLDMVLHTISEDIKRFTHERTQFWTHENADSVWLENAFELCHIKSPVPFRNYRGIRTLVALKKPFTPSAANELPHHALSDAIWQAQYIKGLLLQ